MAIQDIVSEIDAEISRLQQVRSLLTATRSIVKARPGRPAGIKSSPVKSNTRRALSPEARAKIAAAQKLRWARFKKSEKKAGTKSASVAKKANKTRVSVKKATLSNLTSGS